jgi:hypothetical protein
VIGTTTAAMDRGIGSTETGIAAGETIVIILGV